MAGRKQDVWVTVTDDGLEVSPQDDRQHRLLKLPNGLQALLTSDPASDKAAAAMAVDVGAFADPPELPGLAHYCEHMLFLGTEKYPQENAYKVYLSSHGGRCNASTSGDRTVFEFDVAAEHFEGALDIFAQFFVAPLFSEGASGRELNAVDSEDSKNRCNDSRRLLQVFRALADKGHPYGNFSTGNAKTLRDDVPGTVDVRRALLTFHGRHYSAPHMRLVVCGREPLSQLEEWVRRHFAGTPAEPRHHFADSPEAALVANGAERASVPPPAPPFGVPFDPPFAGLALPLLIEVAPLRELRELLLFWPMPTTRTLYRASALRLFSHLLGHEGEGSVFAILQDRGWATALSAGVGHDDARFCMFQVRVTLTVEGEGAWHQIAKLVLRYCDLLRGMGPEDIMRHWAEVQQTAALSFRFQQKPQPYSYAEGSAQRLLLVEPRHVLSSGLRLDDLRPEGAAHLAARLVPGNMMVRWVSQRFSGSAATDQERWYGVPFSRRPLPPEAFTGDLDDDLCKQLHLPLPNEFIPDDLSLRGDVEEPQPKAPVTPPQLLQECDAGRLWHKLDDRYAQPRIEVYVLLRSPVTRPEPMSASLLTAYLSSRLKQSTYAASVAGLHWSLSGGGNGFMLSVSGYSQRAPQLLGHVLQVLLEGPWEGEPAESQQVRFEAVRERAERAHRNWDLERPDAHASYWTGILMAPKAFTVAEKLELAKGTTLAGLKDFHGRFLGRMFAECFVHGNASADDARALFQATLSRLSSHQVQPFAQCDWVDDVRNQLQPSDSFEIHAPVPNSSEENSAVHVHFQAGVLEPPQQAALRMIAQVMREPCFNELRTQQQLGYIVQSGIDAEYVGRRKIEGFGVTVVSKQFSAAEIVSRIDAFLAAFRSNLEDIQPEAWASHVEALVVKLLEPPKRLTEEAGRHWSTIRNQTLRWHWREELAAALRASAPGDALSFYDSLLVPGKRRRIGALIYGKAFPMGGSSEGDALPAAAAPGASVLRAGDKAYDELRASLPRFGD